MVLPNFKTNRYVSKFHNVQLAAMNCLVILVYENIQKGGIFD